MSFAPLPAPGSAASSSIWARRMITKSVPATDAEVDMDVLSLLLDANLGSFGEQDLATSPVSLHSPHSPWSSAAAAPNMYRAASFGAAPTSSNTDPFRSTSPAPFPAVQRSRSMDTAQYEDGYSLEMHAAHTAVKAALDVLEEPSLKRGLRISTSVGAGNGQSPNGGALGLRGCLTAPLSPSLSSPVSPAESCFSGTESDGTKKKGRARMSQEKRKRLARRREREALISNLAPTSDHHQQQQFLMQQQQQQQYAMHGADAHSFLGHSSAPVNASHFSHSAPSTPMRSYFAPSNGSGFPFSSSPTAASSNYDAAFSTPLSSPRAVGFMTDLPSPALTTASLADTSGFGSVGTPSSSPTAYGAKGMDISSSPPTLVIQPPSPQRMRTHQYTAKQQQQPSAFHWNGFRSSSNLASVY